MSERKIAIRSWKEMWNDYIYEGFKKGLKNPEIRQNLIEAFRKEIFDQIMDKANVQDINEIEQTMGNSDMVRNIFRNSYNKWKRLVAECRKSGFRTASLIRENDLTLFDKKEDDEEEYEDEEDIPEEEPKSELEEGSAEVDGVHAEPAGAADETVSG